MHYAIIFESEKFDLENEKPNPITPIHGISLGKWLSPLLVEKDVEVTEIDAEDWGWYLDAIYNGQKYLVGFIALPDNKGNEKPELIILVEKKLSLFEVLTFKNKMNQKDELLMLVYSFVGSIEDIGEIEISKST